MAENRDINMISLQQLVQKEILRVPQQALALFLSGVSMGQSLNLSGPWYPPVEMEEKSPQNISFLSEFLRTFYVFEHISC